MPRMKWNLPSLLYNETSEFNYGLSYTDANGDDVEIYSTQDFLDKVVYKYTSWCMSAPHFFDPVSGEMVYLAETIDQALGVFHATYDLWKKDRTPGFAKLYEAMRKDYNPIWNVDGVTGVITEDNHTGTDTLTKRGTDTGRTSGSDSTAASGNDVTRFSGQDVDTLSGTDVTRNAGSDVLAETGTDTTRKTGTITDGHTGTITKAKDGDDTLTIEGKEKHAKAGKEATTEGVWTYDDDTAPKNSKVSTTEYPPLSDSNARADIIEFEDRTDTTEYNSSETQTNNNTDTTTNNLTDAVTYGKTDTTTYGKTESLQHGKVDTFAYGKNETLQHGKVDTTTYGKQDQMTYNTTDTDTKNLKDQHIEMQIRQGNIGVVSTQKMLNEEIDLRSRDALIDYFIADFIHTNCII